MDFRHVNGASADKHLVETIGSGGLFFDYDNDGWIDIFLVDGGSVADPGVARQARHRLFRNRGNGTFEDVTERSGRSAIANTAWAPAPATTTTMAGSISTSPTSARTSCTATAATASSRMSRARPRRIAARGARAAPSRISIATATSTSSSPTTWPPTPAHSPFCGNARLRIRFYCHPLNFEPLPNIVYRNDGKGVFSDVSAQSGIGAHRGNSLGVVIADFDDDRWPEVFVANDSMPNFLFHGTGGWRFTEIALRAGVAVATDGSARAGMGTDAGDYDGDGQLDLVVTNLDFEMHSLYRGLGDRSVRVRDARERDRTRDASIRRIRRGVLRLRQRHAARSRLRQRPHHGQRAAVSRRGDLRAAQSPVPQPSLPGGFVEVGRSAGPGFALEKVSRGLVSGDIDNDGDLDLLVTNNGQTADLLRNDGGSRQQRAARRERSGHASNRDGIGTQTPPDERDTNADSRGEGRVELPRSERPAPAFRARAMSRSSIDSKCVGQAGEPRSSRACPANQIITIREGDGIVASTPFAR